MNRKARAKTVWLSLGASLTLVTALLFVVGPAPTGTDRVGLAISPLTRLTGQSTTLDIFNTRTPVEPGRWTAIVIQHTGSQVASPADLNAQHRTAGYDGMGYHFVIGNGLGMEDGSIHVGYRWLDQTPGVNASGDGAGAINNAAIAIALVGDGNRRPFTKEQLATLAELIAVLGDRCSVPRDQVLLHSQVARTDSPGQFFPAADFRQTYTAVSP